MSLLDGERFHRAARDGHLDLLQEGNRKELNAQDEDGMTPAMWAAYYGHLDALRLIVGRGGDPDKCDFYGNTPLHCASGNGHVNCVSFLVNFGVNLWALDNDFHTAKDVSVLNRRDDVLRLLDQAQAKHSLVNKKLVQRLKEKSIADAEKRIKSYRKLQLKAIRKAEKEEKLLERQRKKLTDAHLDSSISAARLAAFRRDSRFLYAPKFSDIVHGVDKKVLGAVSKKSGQQRKKGVEFNLDNVVEIEPSCQTPEADGDENSNGGSQDTNHSSNETIASDNSTDDTCSDFHHTTDSGLGDEITPTDSSMFERPGFGSMAFRNSTINLSTLCNLEEDTNNNYSTVDNNPCSELSSSVALAQETHKGHCHSHSVSDSIGSASSLVRRHISWEDEYEEEEEDHYEVDIESEEVGDEDGVEPVVLFLSALGLSEYAPLFQAEKIDLESLSLLTEEDLKTIGMPLGPRRKLENALERRRQAFEEPGTVQDSKL